MQRALLESEERFRAIVETTEDWIWEMDASGQLLYSNSSAARLLGRIPQILIGSNVYFVVSVVVVVQYKVLRRVQSQSIHIN